jgi:hypothetical protein
MKELYLFASSPTTIVANEQSDDKKNKGGPAPRGITKVPL